METSSSRSTRASRVPLVVRRALQDTWKRGCESRHPSEKSTAVGEEAVQEGFWGHARFREVFYSTNTSDKTHDPIPVSPEYRSCPVRQR